MFIDKATVYCKCDQNHDCVCFEPGEHPSVEEVIAFAQEHKVLCSDSLIIRFPGCCQDFVSIEGLSEALANANEG